MSIHNIYVLVILFYLTFWIIRRNYLANRMILPARLIYLIQFVSRQIQYCPIRVILLTPADDFEVLKVKRRLPETVKYKSVGITSDQTVEQRSHFAKVMSDLKRKKDAGENDIFIKFVNNIPTISKVFKRVCGNKHLVCLLPECPRSKY